jgi:hypothetical protein
MHGLSKANSTCIQSRRAPIPILVSCGGLHNHLQLFTPPLTCCQSLGRFRVSFPNSQLLSLSMWCPHICMEKWRCSGLKAWPTPKEYFPALAGALARLSGTFRHSIAALSLVPLAVFQLFCALLQFLIVVLVYRLCSYMTEIKLAFPPSPLVSPPQEAQCSSSLAFLSVLHVSAALAILDTRPVVQCDHSCEVARSAQVCVTCSNSNSSGSV